VTTTNSIMYLRQHYLIAAKLFDCGEAI